MANTVERPTRRAGCWRRSAACGLAAALLGPSACAPLALAPGQEGLRRHAIFVGSTGDAKHALTPAEARSRGQPFLGWAYETVAFWALMPQNGQCPAGLAPVYRAYNNRAAQLDSNHRFMTDGAQRAAMAAGWADEGTQLCAGA